ncbi:hypothetical protein M8494_04580 [Serratia ureilytica]
MLKLLHERILEIPQQRQESRQRQQPVLDQPSAQRPDVGYLYVLTPLYIGNKLEALLEHRANRSAGKISLPPATCRSASRCWMRTTSRCCAWRMANAMPLRSTATPKSMPTSVMSTITATLI